MTQALRALLGAALFASLWTLGLGCTATPVALGGQCDKNTDCQAPYVCRLTRCRKECASQRDCPVGSLCFKDAQGLGICRLPVEATCVRDSECPGALRCIASECTEECVESRDCAPGALCTGDLTERRCVSVSSVACVNSAQCAEGLRCAPDGRCRAACAADRDCEFGFECRAGMCVPVAADAGMDSAVVDSGADSSTGDADAGTDAEVDSAAIDSGADGATDGGADVGVDGGVSCMTAGDCTAPNVATADCVGGFCRVLGCAGDFGDCDGDFANGCELGGLSTDTTNCGVCGGNCGLEGTCAAGLCDRVVDVAAGNDHTCFARSNGTVLCVGGRNDYGELGRGTAGPTGASFLQPVSGVSDAISVDTGVYESCVVRSGGTASCFGANGVGQVGNGTTGLVVSMPAAVMTLTDVEEVFVGGQGGVGSDGIACALRTGGAVSCWGHERTRGDGMSGDATAPVEVTMLSDAVDLDAGYRYACAVRTGGSVVCWGEQGSKLGPAGVSADLPTPTAVTGLSDATRVSTGQGHTCAVRSAGEVVCWGDNNSGRLGVDPAVTADSPTPVMVPGITDAVDVDVSALRSCALRSGGVVTCWGGGGATAHVPRDMPGLLATHVSVGIHASCAIRTNGAVACWNVREDEIGAPFTFPPAIWGSPTDHPAFPPTPTP